MGKKSYVFARVEIITGAGNRVPAGTMGEHVTTQLVFPYHMLIKWPGIKGYCDTNPQLVERKKS